MQIPENCLTEQKSPCLTKISEQNENISVSGNLIRVVKDSILQWDLFRPQTELSILHGFIHVEKIQQAFKVNQILLSEGQRLIARKQHELQMLDTQSFLLSTYTLNSVQTNSVLEKSIFLEKVELIQFVAYFFDQKKPFKEFLKAIESRWKDQLSTQAAIQTKILKRAIASDESVVKSHELARRKIQQEHKKVRDEFFYRTFYR